jgi:ABC-2 type transport system ATP-binding protein
LGAEEISMHGESIARLQGVTKNYGPVTALDDLTLDLRRGELLALLGPNGAGKTSAVRLLLGLASPNKGRVSVFGGDPREEEFRARTGAMLQVAQVPETLRVREHIALFSAYYRSPLPMTEVLRAAQLDQLSDRMFRELSGGEKQRVLFALAICGNPDLLVLDEPTAGLDVESRRSLWRQIARFRDKGRTILLTTHYLQEADELADRIVVVNRGRIAAEGTPSEIRDHARGRRIRFRSSADPERINRLHPGLSAHCSGGVCEVVTDSPEVVVKKLLAQIDDLTELEVTGAGLEEAFIAITGGSEEKERVA